jgi:hypothetical protein
VAVAEISEHLKETMRSERELVAARCDELREQAQRLHALAENVDAEFVETVRLLRGMDEMLGLAPQLCLDAGDEELRGRRLREIAVEVLRQRRQPGDVIHYREWFELLTRAGFRVAGRDPLATFLTQLARADGIESVRPRSGLYRLVA